jgi:hypothetical protein
MKNKLECPDLLSVKLISPARYISSVVNYKLRIILTFVTLIKQRRSIYGKP